MPAPFGPLGTGVVHAVAHGAKVLGPPAIDAEFGTIDFLTWLDVEPGHIERFGRLRS